MGLFDYVICDYPLPDSYKGSIKFTTKDLNSFMNTFTITESGQLLEHKFHFEEVPEEERPKFNTPEWNSDNETIKTWTRLMGSKIQVFDGLEPYLYTGAVCFYGSNLDSCNSDGYYTTENDEPYEYKEYIALFKNGMLINIIENNEKDNEFFTPECFLTQKQYKEKYNE